MNKEGFGGELDIDFVFKQFIDWEILQEVGKKIKSLRVVENLKEGSRWGGM